MSYQVKAEPEVSTDLDELAETDPDLIEVAIRVMLDLRDDPWLGGELRERYNVRPLRDCRRIRFDLPDWKDRPRFRLVYRNEPSDGAPGLVRVWSVGPRAGLIAYARSAARMTRDQARERRRSRPADRET